MELWLCHYNHPPALHVEIDQAGLPLDWVREATPPTRMADISNRL
jgi:hypothetical protein